MLDSTRPNSVHPSRCRLQRLFCPRPISMYESAPTHGHDSESPFARSRSNQSFIDYKHVASPLSKSSKLGCLKARLSGLEVYPNRTSLDGTMTMSCRGLKPESMIYTTTMRSSAVAQTSHRIPDSPLSGRPLSPSFLNLSPVPGYQPPEFNLPSDYNSPSDYYPSLDYDSPYNSPFGDNSPLEYQSPPALYASTSSHIKPTKRKPPPLILSDSFHAGHQSPTLAVSPTDANTAPVTPLTPFTPISPRYQMPSEKEQFRRRLLKLQRTLGEQITPGLVVRPKPNPELTAGPPPRVGRSTSDDSPTKRFTLCSPNDRALDPCFSKNLPVLPLPPAHKRKSSAPVPPSPSLHSLKHYLPEPATLTPMTLTAFVESASVSGNVTPTTRSFEFVLNYDVQDSSSEDDEYEFQPDFSFDDVSYPPSPFNSDYMFHSDDGDTVLVDMSYWDLDPNSSRDEFSTVPDTPGVARREPRHGWSGEWNQPHIRDVIAKLRSL